MSVATRQPSKRVLARAFLVDEFKDGGARAAAEIRVRVEERGRFSFRTAQEVAKELGIETVRIGGSYGYWEWRPKANRGGARRVEVLSISHSGSLPARRCECEGPNPYRDELGIEWCHKCGRLASEDA